MKKYICYIIVMSPFLLLGMESEIPGPIKPGISQEELEALKTKFFYFTSDQGAVAKEYEIEYSNDGEVYCTSCAIALHSNQIGAHSRWHENVDGYACDLCRLLFTAKNILNAHLKSDWHYNQTQKSFLQ